MSRDPVDQILEIYKEGGLDVLNKMSSVLGYDDAYVAQVVEDRRDAAAFRALLKHCGDVKLAFTRDNQVRQIKIVARASTCTSVGYQIEVRKAIEGLATEGAKHWPDDE